MSGQPAHLKKITTRAKHLQKSHPKVKWTDLIKKASAQLKKGISLSGTSRKKAKPSKATKVTVKRKTSGRTRVTISGIAMGEMSRQHTLLSQQERMLMQARIQLKQPGLTAKEKTGIRRDIANHQKMITSIKKHITALRRHT